MKDIIEARHPKLKDRISFLVNGRSVQLDKAFLEYKKINK